MTTSDAHVGRWLLREMDYWDGPSRWKPGAAYAQLWPDGRFRCGDLDGTDEAGEWCARTHVRG